jgi:hypothetical protein
MLFFLLRQTYICWERNNGQGRMSRDYICGIMPFTSFLDSAIKWIASIYGVLKFPGVWDVRADKQLNHNAGALNWLIYQTIIPCYCHLYCCRCSTPILITKLPAFSEVWFRWSGLTAYEANKLLRKVGMHTPIYTASYLINWNLN